jgi:hypothetical protein
MSEFNPYMDICICDPYSAQNIACVAVFHHSDDPCEHDELQRSANDGQEHDDFVLLSLPTDEAQHVDQTQGVLPNISDQAKHLHSPTTYPECHTQQRRPSRQDKLLLVFFSLLWNHFPENEI